MVSYANTLLQYLSKGFDGSKFEHGLDAINVTEVLFSKDGMTINGKYFGECTALHLATFEHNATIVSYLLKKSADPNVKDICGNTCLHFAINSNDMPIVKILLENGARLDATCKSGLTGFMLAIHNGNKLMIEFLLNYKERQPSLFKTTLIGDKKSGPLEYAASLLDTETVALLLNAENISFLKESRENVLFHFMYSSQEYSSPDCKVQVENILKLFIKSGININAKDSLDYTLLQWALNLRNEPWAQIFIEGGCDVNIKNGNSETSLMAVIDICSECKSKKEFLKWKNMFELHLKYGGINSLHSKCTLIAYGMVCFQQFPFQIELLHLFWEYGYPYDFQDIFDDQALHCSQAEDVTKAICYQKLFFEGIKRNNVKIVERALKLGAIVRGTSVAIRFPLHFVTSNGFTEIAKILLRKGIQVNKLNDQKQTALQLAISRRHIELCKLLFQHGAYIDYEVEIKKLKDGDEIKTLLQTVRSQFDLVEKGDKAIVDILDNLLETDLQMFLVFTCAADKHKRSLMATAMYYKHDTITKKIMEMRLKYKISTINK